VIDAEQQASQEVMQQGEVAGKAQTQGNIEVDVQKGEGSVRNMEDNTEIKHPKVHEPPFCHRCKSVGHIARECRRG
jgi:hypothetical protein